MTWNVADEIRSRRELEYALQAAIELEHATIPAYLCALFSIVPGRNQEVAAILQSIVREEMLHMALACNVLNAIGGRPRIDRHGFIPRYPGPLPCGVRHGLLVRLERCSLDQIESFTSIEEPERFEPDTIGHLYHEIEQALERFDRAGDLFVGDPARQLTKWKGPGRLWRVIDLPSARGAIEEIVRQGEGASGLDPRGGLHELAHYYRLEEILHGRALEPTRDGYGFVGPEIPFDPGGVWPMQANPRMDELPAGSRARWLSVQFNATYCHLLRALHRVFNGEPEGFGGTIGLMYSLKIQAQTLVQTPLDPEGDPARGPNAGPSFEFVDLDAGIEEPARERNVVLTPHVAALARSSFPPTKGGAPRIRSGSPAAGRTE